jgi:NAD(P)-dependent dehydrogenase (short-subunit alcohol dehydrogenase family)
VPEGARLAFTGGTEADVRLLAGALTAAGFQILPPGASVDACLVLSALSDQDTATRHWNTLTAARSARSTAPRILLLQTAGTSSGLDGLSRTLRKEWPEHKVYAWTLPDHMESWPGIVAHALREGIPDAVLLPEGPPLAPRAGARLQPVAASGASPGTWLITGGARGVTAACARQLAEAAGGTLLLAGRSAVAPWPDGLPYTRDLKTLRGLLAARPRQGRARLSPSEIDRTGRALLAGAEIRDTLAAIRQTGAQVEYIEMDAGDPDSVARALSGAQSRYGPVTGLVHGAGVLADRLAEEKTEAELRRVFAPKVGGLENVMRYLDSARLTHVALFSSAAAFFGNRGQSDYAMANAWLTRSAHLLAQAQPGLRVKVFHWGPWAGGMVDATLAGHFEAQGIPLIPLGEGARIFASELLWGDPDQIELVVGEAWAEA